MPIEPLRNAPPKAKQVINDLTGQLNRNDHMLGENPYGYKRDQFVSSRTQVARGQATTGVTSNEFTAKLYLGDGTLATSTVTVYTTGSISSGDEFFAVKKNIAGTSKWCVVGGGGGGGITYIYAKVTAGLVDGDPAVGGVSVYTVQKCDHTGNITDLTDIPIDRPKGDLGGVARDMRNYTPRFLADSMVEIVSIDSKWYINEALQYIGTPDASSLRHNADNGSALEAVWG